MKISKISRITTEELQLLVEKYNLAEICDTLKYAKTGNNYKRIKERIIKEGLTLKPIDKWGCGNSRIALNEILIENSKYNNNYRLKIRLVKENILEYKCYAINCNNNGIWLGKTLSLQLDHINGINNDNRIENLRFLCPNCHSQTGTFGGKNLKYKC